MMVVEFVLIIQNFVVHVVNYFLYSIKINQNKKRAVYSFNLFKYYYFLQLMLYLNDESFQMVPNLHLVTVVSMMNSFLVNSRSFYCLSLHIHQMFMHSFHFLVT